MGAKASQITSISTVCSFVQVHIKENIKAPRHWPFSSHKGPVTQNMFPFDDIVMRITLFVHSNTVIIEAWTDCRHVVNKFSWMKIFMFWCKFLWLLPKQITCYYLDLIRRISVTHICVNWQAPASRLSGLLPLKFLIVISDMHKNQGRTPGSEWFINFSPGKYIFLVRKTYIGNYLDMICNVQVEIFPLLL